MRTTRERYEVTDDTSQIYDRDNDIFCPAKHDINTVQGHLFVYKNFITGAYIAILGNEITTHQTEEEEWYCTQVIMHGYIVAERPKKLTEVQSYINAHLPKHIEEDGEEDDLIDDYLSCSQWGTDRIEIWPLNQTAKVYAVEGASEGHYIHVDIMHNDKLTTVFLGKTFRGFDHAWLIAKEIARIIT
jgi:hypothetical protein